MICENITIGANGHLHFAGQDTVALAKQYGTPLYLLDEDYIRHQCRVYQNAFKKHFGPSSRPLPLRGGRADHGCPVPWHRIPH